MRDLSKNECDALEALIDGCSPMSVLRAMSEICGLKAAHVALNWQDTVAAKRWSKLEIAIIGILPKAEEL